MAKSVAHDEYTSVFLIQSAAPCGCSTYWLVPLIKQAKCVVMMNPHDEYIDYNSLLRLNKSWNWNVRSLCLFIIFAHFMIIWLSYFILYFLRCSDALLVWPNLLWIYRNIFLCLTNRAICTPPVSWLFSLKNGFDVIWKQMKYQKWWYLYVGKEREEKTKLISTCCL